MGILSEYTNLTQLNSTQREHQRQCIKQNESNFHAVQKYFRVIDVGTMTIKSKVVCDACSMHGIVRVDMK